MEQIRWGIIGCGDVTEVKSGPAFNKISNSSLVAVMRRDGVKAADYAARHGVPKWYDDADDLINDPDVNAIYIATPPLQHEIYTLKALAAGKPVYVEKPMAINAAAAERMREASAAYGVKLSIAHYRRAQPMFLKIKELIETGAIGKARFAQLQMLQPPQSDLIADSESNWRLDPAISGGGLFHDLAPHQLDLMIYFFGPPLSSSGRALNQQGLNQADDLVVGHVVFNNGVVFNGTWCFSVNPLSKTDRCEIVGEHGKISFQIFGSKVVLEREEGLSEFVFDPILHVEQPMIEQVCCYFLDERENPCSSEEAILTMRVIDRFTKP
ncbi:Gfo/Idh/MocA family protein [Pedobacter sp. GR22-6]|uniref:Gfo/Idh/MocA family protein n=1 Tax=Pedobacter sp. GR22-6 TaxID=3127957 RepID=UPI00307D9CFF